MAEFEPYDSAYTGDEYDTAIGKVGTLETTVGGLSQDVETLQGKVGPLETTVAGLSTDVSALQGIAGKRILEATGNNRDRTADILAELNANGVCILGNGEFYTSGIDMPEGSSIIGFGKSSKLILFDDLNSLYAIKMASNCTVKDLYIYGGEIEVSTTEGNRDGILWTGTGTSATSPINSVISGCYISGFTGGGITCDLTSQGTVNFVTMSSCYITNCNIGINIADNSEFNKFVAVRTPLCGIGCVNQSGNNTFIGCDFSKCILGFTVDNTSGSHSNTGHGSCVGCIFNHMDNNAGTGVFIKKTGHGFLFSGCQLFYGKVVVEDAAGVAFVGCEFGKSQNIVVRQPGSGFVNARTLFSDCTFGDMPTTDVSNNTVFSNCYVRGGNGELIDSSKPNRNLFTVATDEFTNKMKHYPLALPAGTYYISFETLTSTDTDATVCGVEFVDSDGYIISNNGSTAFLDRGNKTVAKLTINETSNRLRLRSSDTLVHGEDDTVTFTGAMICTEADYVASRKYTPYCPSIQDLYAEVEEIKNSLPSS